VINLDELEVFDSGSEINEQLLREKGLISGKFDGLKILGRGEITKKLTIEADKFSGSARQKIEQAGGSVVVRG
jgi:large subunit ribosomal protein L15